MANTGLPPYFPPDFREPYPTYVRLRNESALRARYPAWSESQISAEAAEETRRQLWEKYSKLTLERVAYELDRLLRFTREAFPDLAVYPPSNIDQEQLEKKWQELAGNLELPIDDHSYIVAATALGLPVPAEGEPRDQAEQILPRLIGWCHAAKKERDEKLAGGKRSKTNKRRQSKKLVGDHPLLIATLTRHHGYEPGRSDQGTRASVLNDEPITFKELGNITRWSTATCSRRLKATPFKSYRGYVNACRAKSLVVWLQGVNGDLLKGINLGDGDREINQQGELEKDHRSRRKSRSSD